MVRSKGARNAQRQIHSVSYGVAISVFVISLVKLLESLYAARKVFAFPEEKVSQEPFPQLPRLSVVVPARNEERELERSLSSLLDQDYPGLEVIMVNDRSTDGTGRIIDLLAETYENIRVIHIERLPEGWLGKNHAAYTGACRASGEWLLFTDADVRFHPRSLRRAVARAQEEGLDHLTLVPGWKLSGYWLRGIVAFFYMVFLLYQGYYRANLPRYKKGAGVGAFNLIRHSAYRKIGTYQALAQRPDDDLKLGSRVKKLGLRQQMLLGHDLIFVRWYGSLGALARGFEKNAFATLQYSLPRTALYSGSLMLITIWPFAAPLCSRGPVRRLYLGAAAAQLGAFTVTNRIIGWRVFLLAAAYPIFALLFTGVLLRASLFALVRGGIYWRGTFYSNSLLRRSK